MTNNKPPPPGQTWLRYPLRNHNSLLLTIPAHIRRVLNWNQQQPFIVTLVDDHMEVRQLDLLRASGVSLPPQKIIKRKKSWKQAPMEPPPREGGYKTAALTPEED